MPVYPGTERATDEPSRTAGFFDLDKTVIGKSSTPALSRPFSDQGLLNRRRSNMTSMYAGWDRPIKAIAAELIADHRLCERDVVVVSASGEGIVAPIARALGATDRGETDLFVDVIGVAALDFSTDSSRERRHVQNCLVLPLAVTAVTEYK